ncbi:unnamed protein product, partial [Sphacelaria rigidula]
QIITADADGTCRLWDLRTFSCLDSFTMRATDTSAKKKSNKNTAGATRASTRTCMTVVPPYKRVLVGGRTVDRFEVLRDECEDLTDDTAVLTVMFNTTNLTFVTASASAVKVWDGATGELICADAQQSPEKIAGVKPEVTSMCLGTEGRRTIVGDDSGRIKVFNDVNHFEIKDYKYPECMGRAHKGDVRALVFVEQYGLVISASSDRSLAIHDDSQRDNGVLLRRICNASWSEITAVRYSSHLGLIATGSTDGSIQQLWNFELARHEGCCLEKHRYAVSCLSFLDPFPVLFSADVGGYMALWALPPARNGLRFKRLFTWINKQPRSTDPYAQGGGIDGTIPVAVTAVQCQIEMIANSVASISSSATSAGNVDSQELGDVPLSFDDQSNDYAEEDEASSEESANDPEGMNI